MSQDSSSIVWLEWPTPAQLVAGLVGGVAALALFGSGDEWGAWGACLTRAALVGAGVTGALVAAEALADHYLRRKDKGVVVVTGCDSGVGFSLALHAYRLGHTVVAGCLRPEGVGAQRLKREDAQGKEGRMRVVPLDVTDPESVAKLPRYVDDALTKGPRPLRLMALVNNAGVLVFGEFEWQTEQQLKRQLDVNLLGTMRVTKSMCMLLRRYKARVITVSSHCALESLPGLAAYSATKTGLHAWSESLRVELAKLGIHVITLIPGSFSHRTNILSMHDANVQEMKKNMTAEARSFYGDYFERYHLYLGRLTGDKGIGEVTDRRLLYQFECALSALYPKACYVRSPLRYSFYHTAMRFSPVFLRDRIVKFFMLMPEFDKRERGHSYACESRSNVDSGVQRRGRTEQKQSRSVRHPSMDKVKSKHMCILHKTRRPLGESNNQDKKTQLGHLLKYVKIFKKILDKGNILKGKDDKQVLETPVHSSWVTEQVEEKHPKDITMNTFITEYLPQCKTIKLPEPKHDWGKAQTERKKNKSCHTGSLITTDEPFGEKLQKTKYKRRDTANYKSDEVHAKDIYADRERYREFEETVHHGHLFQCDTLHKEQTSDCRAPFYVNYYEEISDHIYREKQKYKQETLKHKCERKHKYKYDEKESRPKIKTDRKTKHSNGPDIGKKCFTSQRETKKWKSQRDDRRKVKTPQEDVINSYDYTCEETVKNKYEKLKENTYILEDKKLVETRDGLHPPLETESTKPKICEVGSNFEDCEAISAYDLAPEVKENSSLIEIQNMLERTMLTEKEQELVRHICKNGSSCEFIGRRKSDLAMSYERLGINCFFGTCTPDFEEDTKWYLKSESTHEMPQVQSCEDNVEKPPSPEELDEQETSYYSADSSVESDPENYLDCPNNLSSNSLNHDPIARKTSSTKETHPDTMNMPKNNSKHRVKSKTTADKNSNIFLKKGTTVTDGKGEEKQIQVEWEIVRKDISIETDLKERDKKKTDQGTGSTLYFDLQITECDQTDCDTPAPGFSQDKCVTFSDTSNCVCSSVESPFKDLLKESFEMQQDLYSDKSFMKHIESMFMDSDALEMDEYICRTQMYELQYQQELQNAISEMSALESKNVLETEIHDNHQLLAICRDQPRQDKYVDQLIKSTLHSTPELGMKTLSPSTLENKAIQEKFTNETIDVPHQAGSYETMSMENFENISVDNVNNLMKYSDNQIESAKTVQQDLRFLLFLLNGQVSEHANDDSLLSAYVQNSPDSDSDMSEDFAFLPERRNTLEQVCEEDEEELTLFASLQSSSELKEEPKVASAENKQEDIEDDSYTEQRLENILAKYRNELATECEFQDGQISEHASDKSVEYKDSLKTVVFYNEMLLHGRWLQDQDSGNKEQIKPNLKPGSDEPSLEDMLNNNKQEELFTGLVSSEQEKSTHVDTHIPKDVNCEILSNLQGHTQNTLSIIKNEAKEDVIDMNLENISQTDIQQKKNSTEFNNPKCEDPSKNEMQTISKEKSPDGLDRSPVDSSKSTLSAGFEKTEPQMHIDDIGSLLDELERKEIEEIVSGLENVLEIVDEDESSSLSQETVLENSIDELVSDSSEKTIESTDESMVVLPLIKESETKNVQSDSKVIRTIYDGLDQYDLESISDLTILEFTTQEISDISLESEKDSDGEYISPSSTVSDVESKEFSNESTSESTLKEPDEYLDDPPTYQELVSENEELADIQQNSPESESQIINLEEIESEDFVSDGRKHFSDLQNKSQSQELDSEQNLGKNKGDKSPIIEKQTEETKFSDTENMIWGVRMLISSTDSLHINSYDELHKEQIVNQESEIELETFWKQKCSEESKLTMAKEICSFLLDGVEKRMKHNNEKITESMYSDQNSVPFESQESIKMHFDSTENKMSADEIAEDEEVVRLIDSIEDNAPVTKEPEGKNATFQLLAYSKVSCSCILCDKDPLLPSTNEKESTGENTPSCSCSENAGGMSILNCSCHDEKLTALNWTDSIHCTEPIGGKLVLKPRASLAARNKRECKNTKPPDCTHPSVNQIFVPSEPMKVTGSETIMEQVTVDVPSVVGDKNHSPTQDLMATSKSSTKCSHTTTCNCDVR